MKEWPIIFSTHSIRGILSGSKTQTRRVIKPQPTVNQLGTLLWTKGRADGQINAACPYGYCQQGETGIHPRLWVKEAWRVGKPQDAISPSLIWDKLKERGQGITVLYEAGGWVSKCPVKRPVEPAYPDDEPMPTWAGKKRPSMFMPRWASRITLEISDVRVQHVQDISEDDAIAEGVERRSASTWRNYFEDCSLHSAQQSYSSLWQAINGKNKPGKEWDAWDLNPFVWAITFRKI
jgi:hypothetical protein